MYNYPTSDPKEAELRANWYRARDYRDAVQSDPDAPDEVRQDAARSFVAADRALSDYLWKRTEAEIAEDRRKHPKAKRNQAKPSDVVPQPGGRALP